MSREVEGNLLADANIVFIYYCGSDGHVSNVDDVVLEDPDDPSKRFRIHKRGHAIVSAIVDTLMAIPQLIFALLLLSIFGANVTNLILVIALLYSPLVFRLARAVAGNIVVMDYIEAARLRGELLALDFLPRASTEGETDPETAARLRALGYVAPDD